MDSASPTPGTNGMLDQEHPLRPIVQEWLKKIELAKQLKKKQFGDAAAECMNFYNGQMDAMYDPEELKKSSGFRRSNDDGDAAGFPAPTFQMQANKVAECVQLFGPILYHKNPYRMSNPRKKPDIPPGIFDAMNPTDPMQVVMGPDPMQQQMAQARDMVLQVQQDKEDLIDKTRAILVEWYLNYTPKELDLKGEAMPTIDEALIKGMGVVWTEITTPTDGGPRLIGSFYDSVDNLVIDPDVERFKDAKWIARRCVHPVWEVEKLYDLPQGSLKPTLESYNRQSTLNDRNEDDRQRGATNDLIVYWKIYSKMGVGGRLAGVDKKYRDVLDQFGDYAFLVVAPSVPYPLNMPPSTLQGPADQALRKLDWPTPFWLAGLWPMVPLAFHYTPRHVWPLCHFGPAMGELKALNWLSSMMISKVGVSCRDFIAMLESLADDVKNAILHGKDFTYIPVKSTDPGPIGDKVAFLQHPEMNADVWKIKESVNEAFEKRTGLSELVYGMSSRQMRSAEEASLKGDQISVRPDDMAEKVETWAAAVARNEALAIRHHIKMQDVMPLMGQQAAQLWQQLVEVQPNDPEAPFKVARQLEYSVEAGSTKKPNKDRDALNMNQAMQTVAPIIVPLAQQLGYIEPVNALISDWCESIDLDPTNYLFPALPPPLPPAPPPGEEETGDEKAKEGEPPPAQQQGAPPPMPMGGMPVGAPPMPGAPPPMNVGF